MTSYSSESVRVAHCTKCDAPIPHTSSLIDEEKEEGTLLHKGRKVGYFTLFTGQLMCVYCKR